MTDERRYDDEEVEAILEAAVERRASTDRLSAGEEGLTLAEIQEIAGEVGIPPESVARAASDLDRPRPSVSRWLPSLTVSRTVPLPRRPTEREWEALVSDLRATFRASGTVRSDGGLRGWTNGNLHAWVEPAGSGYRLRMGTTRGRSLRLLRGGGIVAAIGVVVGMLALFGDEGSVESATTLLIIGLALMAGGIVGLPGWAARRRRQREEIGERARARLLADGEAREGETAAS